MPSIREIIDKRCKSLNPRILELIEKKVREIEQMETTQKPTIIIPPSNQIETYRIQETHSVLGSYFESDIKLYGSFTPNISGKPTTS
jgi:hypothetical protein